MTLKWLLFGYWFRFSEKTKEIVDHLWVKF